MHSRPPLVMRRRSQLRSISRRRISSLTVGTIMVGRDDCSLFKAVVFNLLSKLRQPRLVSRGLCKRSLKQSFCLV